MKYFIGFALGLVLAFALVSYKQQEAVGTCNKFCQTADNPIAALTCSANCDAIIGKGQCLKFPIEIPE